MSYKTALGIETPEPDEPPAATGQIRAMAEKIDLLLRKQLTTLVELAKLKITEKLEAAALKVTGTLELPGESITGAMIKNGAVTGAKLAANAVSHYFNTTTYGGGGIVTGSENTVETLADTCVSWESHVENNWLAGEGREGGFVVKLVRNGGVVEERNYITGYNGSGGGRWSGSAYISYLQTSAGSNTWAIQLVPYGTGPSIESSAGVLSFNV